MKFSAVIPTKNNDQTIDKCISSLMDFYGKYISEIIIVDGHSEDQTLSIVNKYPVKIFFEEKKSISNARNIGWKNASSEIILFIDSDVYVIGSFFPDIEQFFSDPKIGAVGCGAKSVGDGKLVKATGEWQSFHYKTLDKIIKEGKYNSLYLKAMGFENGISVTGPCYLVKKECLEQINGFDENHKHGGEEICLSYRLLKKGWKTNWWFDSPIYHHPRSDIIEFIKERYKWGRGDCFFLIEISNNYFDAIYRLNISIITRILSPMFALVLAIRFRNPYHVLYITIGNYSWILGCLASIKF